MSKGFYNQLHYGVLAALMVACGSQPTTFSPNNTDRFISHDEEFYRQASAILAADYLFVIDPSYSMKSEQSHLQATFDSFMQNLDNANPPVDYRIGFLNGNFQATTESSPIPSSQGTALIGSGTLFPGFASNTDVINSLINYIGQPLTPNRNVALETTARYITNHKKEFVRGGAQLVYIFISDTDDRSHNVTGGRSGSIDASHYYVTQLKKAKSDPAYVSSRSIVSGNFNGVGGGCSGSTGTRLYNESVQLNQASSPAGPHNYCIKTDLDLNLNSLATDVTKPTTRFQLLQRPVMQPTSTIKIYVDKHDGNGSQLVPPAGKWSYSPSTNEIVFASGQQPGPSDELHIKYDILYVLTSTPNPDSIQITINGYSTDDWNYVPGENRIAFNSKPPLDAEILVSYEVQ